MFNINLEATHISDNFSYAVCRIHALYSIQSLYTAGKCNGIFFVWSETFTDCKCIVLTAIAFETWRKLMEWSEWIPKRYWGNCPADIFHAVVNEQIHQSQGCGSGEGTNEVRFNQTPSILILQVSDNATPYCTWNNATHCYAFSWRGPRNCYCPDFGCHILPLARSWIKRGRQDLLMEASWPWPNNFQTLGRPILAEDDAC